MSTKLVILGFLEQGPKSGYEIKKEIEDTISFFWDEAFSNIYKYLPILEKELMVTSKSVKQNGKPDKTVYSITQNGRKKLKEWLDTPCAYSVGKNELLIKIFFGGLSDKSVVRNHLENASEYAERSTELYKKVQSYINKSTKDKNSKYWNMTLEYGIRQSQMIKKWADDMLKNN